jgi:hypothetical protein
MTYCLKGSNGTGVAPGCRMTKFLFTTDLHFGYERKNGHKVPLHDSKAWASVVKFAQDFKPHTWIVGGDFLDCASVSHHNHNKPGNIEGLRLLADAEELKQVAIKPVEQIAKEVVYITGNHERWLDDVVTAMPALEGIVDLRSLLGLKNWTVIPQGGSYNLGKLTFIHGDQISGGADGAAKKAVIDYERSVRLGHFHTYDTYTKTSPVNYKNAKTGIIVPCLCQKTPSYGKGKPNKWLQGFSYGFIDDKGFYNDYVVTIIDGKFVGPNGRVYSG